MRVVSDLDASAIAGGIDVSTRFGLTDWA